MIDPFVVEEIKREWLNPRWKGIKRPYDPEHVARLRGSIKIEYTLSNILSRKLWEYLQSLPYVTAIGALTGNQAIQMVEAGLKAIYVSGWQIAADNNEAGQMYPDLGLYPSNSAPILVSKILKALLRRDQIQYLKGERKVDYLAPIVADGEAGFGGILHTFELMKSMIEAGAAGVHFEDQSASERKCGHLGGKVLVPTERFIRQLIAARLASDIADVPAIIIARTDALNAEFIISDYDERDKEFIMKDRTPEGYFRVEGCLDFAIVRALACAEYADMLWFETSKPDLDEAKRFADAVHKKFSDKLLMYNLSPSFNWRKHLKLEEIEEFQSELAKLGYKFQIITLAGFHANNAIMFELSKKIAEEGLKAYVELQEREFELEKQGYSAAKHQSFVGVSYYDEILKTVFADQEFAITSLDKSTEKQQF